MERRSSTARCCAAAGRGRDPRRQCRRGLRGGGTALLRSLRRLRVRATPGTDDRASELGARDPRRDGCRHRGNGSDPLVARDVPSVWAAPANLVLVPWFGSLLLPLSLAAGAWAATPWASDGDRALEIAALVAGSSAAGVEALAAWLPRPPTASAAWPAVCVCVACAWIALRSRKLRVRIAVVTLGVGLSGFVPVPGWAPTSPRLVALDVGSGDSTLLQGRDAAVLVDAGFAAGPRGRSIWGRRSSCRPSVASALRGSTRWC